MAVTESKEQTIFQGVLPSLGAIYACGRSTLKPLQRHVCNLQPVTARGGEKTEGICKIRTLSRMVCHLAYSS